MTFIHTKTAPAKPNDLAEYHFRQERRIDWNQVSQIIPARNEVRNIKSILKRVPEPGCRTELIFVEGHSSDNTFETIKESIAEFNDRSCRLFQQTGK
jgi:hypothetical protein